MIKKGVHFANTLIQFLFVGNGYFPSITDRIKLLSKIGLDRDSPSRFYLLKQQYVLGDLIHQDQSGRYFDIDGFKVYFNVNYRVAHDERLLHGMRQAIYETFIETDLFTPNVNISQGDTVIDVGANIGATSLLFSRLCGANGTCIAVEPVTPDVIQKNISENAISNIQIIPKGVSDRSGTAQIEISDFCLDASIAHRDCTKGYYNEKRTIDLMTLDELVEELELERVDLVCMDIEGAEELALKGAERLIRRFHPKWTISSYHIDFENEPQHKKLVQFLKKHGYHIQESEDTHIYAY